MSTRTETLVVESSRPGLRLDTYLRERFPGVSRAQLQRLIREGAVRVNGAPSKPTHAPRAGEIIHITWPEPREAAVPARALPLAVVYEDAHLLVLNKAPGMVVHPAAGTEDDTLVNALLHHCRGRLSGIGGVARPGIVHRLDQFTSGLMVVAKDDATHVALARQFAARAVVKLYHAVLCGELPRTAGEINAPIARHPSHRKVMTVLEGGRAARTSYRVLERLRGATLVEARLHTGRTHQVRVHFKHLGYPLAGDLTYGARATARLEELTGVRPPRQMLHAQRLAFTHPATGATVEFEAPWPSDFAAVVAALREGDQPSAGTGGGEPAAEV
jgi:23S rRNA pseudouridine1911/1915/1917 synthase